MKHSIHRLITLVGAVGALSGCYDSMGLDGFQFACGVGLPCAAGFECVPSSTPSITSETICQPIQQATSDVSLLDTGPVLEDIGDDTSVTPPDSDVAIEVSDEDTSLKDIELPDPDTPLSDTCLGDNCESDKPCDPAIHPLCFSSCKGSWPYEGLEEYVKAPNAVLLDISGDGHLEVVVHGNRGLAVLSHQGEVIYENLAPESVVHARGPIVAAQTIGAGLYGGSVKSLSLFASPGGSPTLLTHQFTLSGKNSIKEAAFGQMQGYDNAQNLAWDLDGDLKPEFITASDCDPIALIYSSDLKLLSSIASLDSSCTQDGARLLTDLDGDGVAELLVGVGLSNKDKPALWKGAIRSYSVANPTNPEPFCDANNCFPTAWDDLHPAGIRRLTRIADRIFAEVRYYTKTEDGEEVNLVWEYTLNGGSVGPPKAGGFPTPTDINRDSVPESVEEMTSVGLWDVNQDGLPDRIYTEGNKLRVALQTPDTGKFEDHKPATHSVGESDLKVTSIGDANADGRLEVIITNTQGIVSCRTLGEGTFNRSGSLPPHLQPYLRTGQWDNYEPNDGGDINKDGIPDIAIKLSSALTANGYAYSYLSHPDDVDTFIVEANAAGDICLVSPPGRAYQMQVFAFSDKKQESSGKPIKDGKPDGLVWTSEPNATNPCFSGKAVTPHREGDHKFLIQITPGTKGYEQYWPYWIETPNTPSPLTL